MSEERIEHLESRIGRLEEDVRPLLSLPQKMQMVIDGIKETNEGVKETNRCIQEMPKQMQANYVSKEVMDLRLDTMESKIKLWLYATLFFGLTTAVGIGIQVWTLVKGGH